MRWRKAAAAGGAALGAAALYNATAEHRAAPLVNELGGESEELLWRGHRITYTRHGTGSPVLLVHGLHAGASSYEWRHTIDSLAERYTVFALDLLGFGRSARPRVRYTSAPRRRADAARARTARGRRRLHLRRDRRRARGA
jgi:alpha-beta hydrolase superfamily lysophospholipase